MFNQYGYKMLRDILAEERELNIYPDKLDRIQKYEYIRQPVQDFKTNNNQDAQTGASGNNKHSTVIRRDRTNSV